MKVLGIDFGKKVIGLALGFNGMAVPYDIIIYDDMETALERIHDVVHQEEIEEIVIGFPVNDGKEPEYIKEVNAFIEQVKEYAHVPVALEDERFSTQEARRFGQKKDRVDAQAAALILQGYLDKQQT